MTDHVHDGSGIDCPDCGTAITTGPYTVIGYGRERDTHTVVAADYHRNGSGGAGFIVALIDTLAPEATEPTRYLLTWFPQHDKDGNRLNGHCEEVAVVAVDQVAAGNIYMHAHTDVVTAEYVANTGGAAYRGADNWAVCLPVIERFIEDSRIAADTRWARERASR